MAHVVHVWSLKILFSCLSQYFQPPVKQNIILKVAQSQKLAVRVSQQFNTIIFLNSYNFIASNFIIKET
jgi:hypothetical protein